MTGRSCTYGSGTRRILVRCEVAYGARGNEAAIRVREEDGVVTGRDLEGYKATNAGYVVLKGYVRIVGFGREIDRNAAEVVDCEVADEGSEGRRGVPGAGDYD
jgi:hypothetical protein